MTLLLASTRPLAVSVRRRVSGYVLVRCSACGRELCHIRELREGERVYCNGSRCDASEGAPEPAPAVEPEKGKRVRLPHEER